MKRRGAENILPGDVLTKKLFLFLVAQIYTTICRLFESLP